MKISHLSKTFQALLAVVLFSSGPLYAADPEPDVAALNQKIEALQRRVDQLEAEKKNAWGAGSVHGLQGSPQWDPFEQMNQMQQEMDQMFQNSFGQPGARPGVFSGDLSFGQDFDFKETKDGYQYTFDMTGLDKDKVDIQINAQSITLKGEQSRKNDVQGPNQRVSSQSFGTFLKTIPIPNDADVAKVKTEKVNDSLIIHIPKKS
ncbi:MAG: Hsp20/alpha crystallin family protein [Candidatus Omnitrophica bacterium]|nr:Hsp20/alpha crystallin family protein [Candidatus Omnitrophota bacterium]